MASAPRLGKNLQFYQSVPIHVCPVCQARKALVLPTAHQQEGKPCLQDRREQPERNIYVLHLCDRLNQEYRHDNLGVSTLSLGIWYYLLIAQGIPG